jgi:tetratricopeptide (TPR) repeat protein
MSASALPRWLLSSLLGLAGVLGGKAALAQAAADTEPVAVRIAKALSAEERYLGAAMTLLGLDPSGTPERLPEAQQWELADTLLRLAQRDAAQAIYRSLAVSSLDTERYARAQLQVAEQDLQRGRLQAATEVLDALRERLPRGQLLAWQELRARLLLAQGRYGEAAEILAELDTRDQPSHYVRYNLGVALINDGRALDGRDILDRVGRMVVRSVEDQALRDKANLTLGWHFLQNEQGGTAKGIFQRIRVEGPFSNRALLGLGWAELAPRGERQARGTDLADEDPFANFSTLGGLLRPGFLERDVYQRAGFRNFRLGSIAEDQQEALRRALAAWVELISRDPLDPAVQEGWLAIPYSLDRLGAHEQALQYYERAVSELEKNRERMRQAMSSIDNGRMVETIVRRDLTSESGRDWKLRDLPDAPETYYLQNLLAEHRFQEALKNYRDLRLLTRNLDSWNERLEQMDRQYREVPRKAIEPEILLQQARLGSPPPKLDLRIRLRAETQLAAPGRYGATAPDVALPQLALKSSAVPVRFNGPFERTSALRGRLAVVRAQLEVAAGEQSAQLTRMARAELHGQQQVIEKYLVEARFALARLYDRQLKGEF